MARSFQGVPIFLSGYFIWGSLKNNSARGYFIKRFIRIYPELWITVAFSVLALMPFISLDEDKLSNLGCLL